MRRARRAHRINLKSLARFFWFTIEFGLMREKPGSKNIKVYGSGLLSSYGEIETLDRINRWCSAIHCSSSG